MARVGAYQVLAKVLEENKQTGAAKILIDGIQNFGIPKELDVFTEMEIEVNGIRLQLHEFFPAGKLKLAQEIFQGCISTLEMYDSFVTKNRTFTLATSNIPSEPPFYVPRFLSNRIEIHDSIFKADCPDIFVFKNSIGRYKLSEIASPHWTAVSSSQLNHVTARFIYLDDYEDWIELKQKAIVPIHLISYDAVQSKYILKDSSAAHEILSRVDSKEKRVYLSEDEFLQQQLSEDLKVSSMCICDSPGMGKTFLLSNVARALSKHSPGTVVAFIQLSTFVADCFLLSKNQTTDPQTAFLNVLKSITNRHAELLLALIQAELLRMEIFFDGFDEIPSDKVEWMKQVFLSIKSQLPNVRMYIASRPHMRHELEKSLGVIAYDILPFNFQNQVDYLVKFWSTSVIGLDQISLENYARKCLEEINETLMKSDKEMAGIPLLCQLIAEVYAKKVRFYSTTGVENTEVLFRVPKLYQKFIEKRIAAGTSTEEEIKNIKLVHIFHALKIIFPTYGFHSDKVFIKVNQITASSVVLKAGIIQLQSNSKFEFIHRTFAEYFVAEYFSGKLRKSMLKPNTFFYKFFNQNYDFKKWLTLLLATDEFTFELIGSNDKVYDMCYDFYKFGFTNSVIVTFIDFSLSENLNSAKNTSGVASYCASLSPENFISILCACCYHNLYSLFAVLKEVLKKWNFFKIKKYFTTKSCCLLLKVCIIGSTSQMFHGCIQLLTKQLKLDVEQIVKYDEKEPLLHMALQVANYEAVEYLLNSVSFEPANILEKCVQKNYNNSVNEIKRRENILNLLLNKKPTIIQDTPNILASFGIDLGLFKILVELGANLTAINKVCQNCVMVAAEDMTPCDYHELVEFLLKDSKAEYLFLENEKWKDPLSYIVEWAELLPETLDLLFSIPGADINMKDSNGENLLFPAVQGGQLENLQQLLKRGLDYNARGRENRSLMHAAAEGRGVDTLRYLLSLELDPNSCADDGCTPLHCAVDQIYGADVSVVEVLVKNGANIQAKNKKGQTALHLSAAKRYPSSIEIIQYLIENGAGVNDPDKDGNTPLHLCQRLKVVDCLVGLGADVHAKNIKAQTALHLYAARDDFPSIVFEYLIENGVGVNDRDKDGNTPLHHCITRAVMDCLIGLGADIHAKNTKGQTPAQKNPALWKSTNIDSDK